MLPDRRDGRRAAGRRGARAGRADPAPPVRGGKLAGWLALVGSLAALNYASRFSSGKPPADSLYRYDTALSGLVFYALDARDRAADRARDLTPAELGLRRPDSWPRALGFTLGVLVALLIAEALLETCSTARASRGSSRRIGSSAKAVQFALNAAVVVIAAPLVEELTFRGVGFRLLSPFGAAVARRRHVGGLRGRPRARRGLPGAVPVRGRGRARSPANRQPLPGDAAARVLQRASRWRSPSPASSSMFPTVRRAAIFLAAMAFAPAAHAAPPAVTAQATPCERCRRLWQVTLTASGDTATYHWELGDGTTADGPVVQHIYAAGRFTARVTATNPLGETSQATVEDHLRPGSPSPRPGAGRYQQLARFHGRLVPAVKGARLGALPRRARGSRPCAPTAAGTSSSAGASARRTRATPSATRAPSRTRSRSAVRPGLDTAFSGSGRLGHAALAARPRAAGQRGHADREASGAGTSSSPAAPSTAACGSRLPTGSAGAYRVRLTLATGARLRRGPAGCSSGSSSPRRSGQARQGRAPTSSTAGCTTSTTRSAASTATTARTTSTRSSPSRSCTASPRTGAVDARFWIELQRAQRPAGALPRRNHVEVSKDRQVLFLVRDGQVALIVHGLDRRHRQHAARPLARLQQGAGLQREGDVLLVVLRRRLRDPRLPQRARRIPRATAACGSRCGSRIAHLLAGRLRHGRSTSTGRARRARRCSRSPRRAGSSTRSVGRRRRAARSPGAT